MTTKKKLPLAGTPTPASAQKELAVTPVAAGSRPEFPTRGELYRKASLLGGATLLAGSLAHADAPAKPVPPPPPQKQAMPKQPPAETPTNPELLAAGSIDGKPLDKVAPKFKVYREGGGIGPAEDMWNEEEVEAFINWTMAREGKLAIQTKYKLELDGTSLELDGFDPDKNVGYQYVDKLDYEAKQAFDKTVQKKLEKWQKDKKVAILFISIARNPDAATIKGKVIKFLNGVKKAPPQLGKLPSPPPPATAPAPTPAPTPAPMPAQNAPAKPVKK